MTYPKPHCDAVQARVRQYEDHVRTGKKYSDCKSEPSANICDTVPVCDDKCENGCLIDDCTKHYGNAAREVLFGRPNLLAFGTTGSKNLLIRWYRELISRANTRLANANQVERIVGTLTDAEIERYLA